MTIEFGRVYRDALTGFVGAATARAEYMHSAPEIQLEADTGAVGDHKTRWVKEARLEEVVPDRPSGFGS